MAITERRREKRMKERLRKFGEGKSVEPKAVKSSSPRPGEKEVKTEP